MLAKLIQARSVPGLAVVEWRPAQALEEGAPPMVPSAAEVHAADSADVHGEIPALQAELERERASAEQRIQEAFAAARRDAEQSARVQFEQQVEAEVQKLRQMLRDVVSSGAKLRRQSEEDLVRLSVAIARRILHRELSIDPEALTGLVKAAFQRLDWQRAGGQKSGRRARSRAAVEDCRRSRASARIPADRHNPRASGCVHRNAIE
jgi:flagellar biosynthesis/type III secretory pathway protein FliH